MFRRTSLPGNQVGNFLKRGLPDKHVLFESTRVIACFSTPREWSWQGILGYRPACPYGIKIVKFQENV